MMSGNQLVDKIKKELLKSGFPLELRCRRVIYQHDWLVGIDRFYMDSEGVEHEIDCIAYKQTSFSAKGNPESTINSVLIVECKKNEANYWVFFGGGGIQELSIISTLNANENEKLALLTPKSLRRHHYIKMKPTGSFCMAFRKEKNQIFGALNEVLNAYKYNRAGSEKYMNEADSSEGLWMNVYYPAIVFDGRLFIAELVEDKLEVEETDHILYTMRHPSYLNEWISIDVVRADVFSNYLDALDKDHEILVSHIKSKLRAYPRE